MILVGKEMLDWMKWFFHGVLREKVSVECLPVTSFRHGVILAVFFAITVLTQVWGFGDPYHLAFETGFQELIARRHLDPGLAMTRGLSTLNNLGSEPTFHANHPPLLQLTLAGLYAFLGESEAVARLIPLFSFLALFWGIWRITRYELGVSARLAALAAVLIAPLSSYSGRIVNFEPPVIACIVWTAVWLEDLNHGESWRAWFGLGILGVFATLIDWPYPLFVMCLWLAMRFRAGRSPRYTRAVWMLWMFSMSTAAFYVLAIYGAGVFSNLMQHARLQTGALAADKQFQWPPILVSWQWWKLSVYRCAVYGTPIFTGGVLIEFIHGFIAHRFQNGLYHLCLVLASFCLTYISLFSRASYNHLWCYFYLAPLLGLSFGLLAERLKPWVVCLLLAAALFFAAPVTYDLRLKTPLRASVQAGRTLAAATQCLPQEQRRALNGPLLFVNRVDPLPYYAQCETAFSHLSVRVAAPDKFLLRFRPEFVVLSGYNVRSTVTVRPEYSPALWERLTKSYTRVHHQEKMEMWESLWSPYLSLMGLLQAARGNQPETALIDDRDEVHVGTRLEKRDSPVMADLSRVSGAGRRWLHGWIIANEDSSSTPVSITVTESAEHVFGTIAALPQKVSPRWQEFWLPLGEKPERIFLTWNTGTLLLGDLRLMNEILWADDLTQVLRSEIQRRLGPNAYPETFPVQSQGEKNWAILQHPGMGVDDVDLPPLRLSLDPELRVTYGLNPSSSQESDGVTFRLSIQDHALGERELLFEDFVKPASSEPWHTRKIVLEKYSRHVVTFTFSVDAGPQGNANNDHALWCEAKLISSDEPGTP